MAKLPRELRALFVEMVLKHGTDEGLPDPDDLDRVDPDLAARIRRAASRFGPVSFPEPSSRQRKRPRGRR